MSRPRIKEWEHKSSIAETEMDDLLRAWGDDLDDKDESLETTRQELEDARKPPEYGNCKRGCPPAYLDKSGFCSPACAMGAPRGEFVTLASAV